MLKIPLILCKLSNMMRLILILFVIDFFLFQSVLLKAQDLTPIDSIEVIQGGRILNSAWAGGINNAQLSEMDLNNDGKKDLFVFDRNGNRITTYLNKGGIDTIKFVYAPQYESKFPDGLTDWVLLRDLNCDGKQDVLSSVGNGFKVFYNTSSSTELSFELASNMVNSDFGGNLISNLYVSRVDIPAIIDMDNDGDLDVLTFPVGGTTIEYHRNYSIENGQGCKLDQFKLEDACWGKVKEDFATNSVYLNQTCRGWGFVVEDQNIQHAGSTVFAFDSDGDGDKEVVLGDISFPKATFLFNSGTINEAYISSQDSIFPSYDVPVNLYIFPAFYSIDANNDGQNDVIACPNGPNASDNFSNVWLYKDIDTSKAVYLELQQRNFLQDQMIDVGEGAFPSFFDYNQDGLTDIIIGNYSYKVNGVGNSKLVSYKNTGTLQKPKFTLDNSDFAGLLQYAPLANLAPCFGDVDYDGDKDMLIGTSVGEIMFFENTAGNGNTASFSLKQTKMQNIDVGNFAKPTLYDLNNDNRLDLIIGGSDGRLSYYQDTATSGLSKFKLIKKPFGNINIAAIQGNSVGYASPAFCKEDNNTVLYVGSANGPILKFGNIDGNLTGTFSLVNDSVANLNLGFRTHPAIADLNNDGINEMLIGNYAGGVRLFSVIKSTGFSKLSLQNLTIFPNPATNSFKFHQLNTKVIFEIYNLAGKLILEANYQPNETVDISMLTSGLYFVKVLNNFEHKVFKLLKE